MRGRRFLAMPADYRRELFEEIHQVVVERFGPGVAAGLQPTQQVVSALISAGRYDDVEAFAEWEAGIVLTAVPETVEWEGGRLRVGFTAEYTSGGEPLTFPADTTPTPLDDAPRDQAAAVAWVGMHTHAHFDRATADLLLRERIGGARYFQPVEFTREVVRTPDTDRVRLVLRATATVDPATLTRDGLWDAFARVKLGGWTKECRVGPAPHENRPTPRAGVVGAHVVLPYWTSPHAHLALDVDRATRRLGLGDLGPDDVTVDAGRLRAALPLYVPDPTEATLRLTSSGTVHDTPATLSPTGSGARLEAALPVDELRGATWRPALGAPGPRFLPLPFALRPRGDTVQVVRPPHPGVVRLFARTARRRLGPPLRRALSALKAGRR
jgi:poly(ribitol-phosphate) beta-N-acetylglucosaminyltransferase